MPSFLKEGFNFANRSIVIPFLGCSSDFKTVGIISFLKFPFFSATVLGYGQSGLATFGIGINCDNDTSEDFNVTWETNEAIASGCTNPGSAYYNLEGMVGTRMMRKNSRKDPAVRITLGMKERHEKAERERRRDEKEAEYCRRVSRKGEFNRKESRM